MDGANSRRQGARPPELCEQPPPPTEEQLNPGRTLRAAAPRRRRAPRVYAGARSPNTLARALRATLLCAAPSFDAASRADIDCAGGALCRRPRERAAPPCRRAAPAGRLTRRSPCGGAAVGHWAVAHHGFRLSLPRALRRLLDVSEAAPRRCPAAVAWATPPQRRAPRAAGGEARDEVPIASANRAAAGAIFERRLHCIKGRHEAEQAAPSSAAVRARGGGRRRDAAGGVC